MTRLPPRSMPRRVALATLSTWILGACATGPSTSATSLPDAAADPWAGLAAPRPEADPDAPRIAVSEIGVGVVPTGWNLGVGDAAEAVTELVKAGLLERTDVRFVERKRFVPAAERERRGAAPERGQPPVGTSEGAEWLLTGSYMSMPGLDSARLDLRILHVESGTPRESWSLSVPAGLDPTGVARTAVNALLARLSTSGIGPGVAAPADPVVRTGIPSTAVREFLTAVRAGDRWSWDPAREAYQRAIREGAGEFAEAAVGLRRVARLRAGGSLGIS